MNEDTVVVDEQESERTSTVEDIRYVVVGVFERGIPIARGPFDNNDEAAVSLSILMDLYGTDTYANVWGVFDAYILPLDKT